MRANKFQSKSYHANSPATQEHTPELQYTGSSKLLQNHWRLTTHYWTIHTTPERRNRAPPTRTPTQASLTKKHWQAADTTPPTVRKLHNKENSTNSQNTERPPQTQQYNQDEKTEEYPAGKGTGEMPTKPNKRGRDRESTWERILNNDSENDPKPWHQNIWRQGLRRCKKGLTRT